MRKGSAAGLDGEIEKDQMTPAKTRQANRVAIVIRCLSRVTIRIRSLGNSRM